MAYVLSSVSGNLISAASAGFAPTNSADVSAIASSYQVVSATGTQTYAGTAYVTSVNEAPLSAARAGNAANAVLATSAWYDGTGRLLSSLPDEATVSAIASAYQVVSSVGTSQNGPKSIVTGINGLFISARYADTANEARKDGSGRTISSLPDSAAVSAIASSYAESAASSKQDKLTFGYDAENKISSIDGSALAGGGGTTYTFDNPLKESAGVVSLDFDTDTLVATTTTPSTVANFETPYNGWSGYYNFLICEDDGRLRDSFLSGTPYGSITLHIPGNTFYTDQFLVQGGIEPYIQLGKNEYFNNEREAVRWKTPLTFTQDPITGYYILDEQDVTLTFPIGDPDYWTVQDFNFGSNIYLAIGIAQTGYDVSNQLFDLVDNTQRVVISVTVATTTAGPLTVKDPLPAHTSAESGKVLSVNASGGTEWVTPSAGGGIDSATCSAIASAYAESAVSSKADSSAMSSYVPYSSLEYNAASAISGINGSALAGGGINVSPNGTLWISGESAESTDSAFIPGVATETFVQSGGSFQIGTTQPLTVAGANKVTIQDGSWFDGTIYVSGNGTLVSSVAHAGADWPQTFTAEAPITIGANGWFNVTAYSAFNVVTSPDQVVQLAHASAVSGYALSSDVSATVDLVSTQSANWGGSALALSAGPGVKLEKVGNTLVASTDETVLFSGSNAGMVATNLSEPLSGFNSFKICFNPFGGGMSREWKEFSWAGSSDVYTVATFHKNGNDNLAWYAAFQPNTEGTTLTPIANKLWILGSTTVQDRTQMTVYRVVGINRTAGV